MTNAVPDVPRHTPPISPTPSPAAPFGGKRALIIGGSSGIGLATARLLLDAGAVVTVASRSAERRAAAAALLGERVTSAEVDVTDGTSLDRLFEQLERLDHVYLAAGGLAAGPVVDTPWDVVRVGIEERIRGAYELTRRAVPRLAAGGSLTFTSGPSAVRGWAGLTISTTYNTGIEAFARSLALEIAPLRANVVRPGQTDTPFLHGFLGGDDPATVAAAGESLPLGRVGRPEEVAAAVLFLMSNPYATGSTVAVDGGITI